nr:ribonuclease H-like domain-containing protein [Tanacetum cinerariifolium]
MIFATLGVTKDLNHENFLDNENSKRPNDEGRVSFDDDGLELSSDINQGNDDSGATSMDERNNTHPEGTVPDETKVKCDVERVVNYANLNHDNYCFIFALNKSIEPTCYEEAIFDSNWIDAMNAEIEALNENHTLEITDLPPNGKAIGNKWIYKIKYKSSGDIDIYKAILVVKGFNQKEGIDFDETFSLVVKMSTIRCVIALSVTNNWHLFQLDVNNAFLYGDLDENIYMTIPKWFANKDNKIKENDFVQSANDNSLFTKSKNNKFIALLVYVDDIVITEVIKTGKDLCLSQRKYCLELLKDYGLLGCKPVATPIKPNSILPYVSTKDDPLLENITGYQNLLEAEYISLSSAACEIIWIRNLLLDLNTKVTLPIDLHCDNKSALQLAINLVFHERFKVRGAKDVDSKVDKYVLKGLVGVGFGADGVTIVDELVGGGEWWCSGGVGEGVEFIGFMKPAMQGCKKPTYIYTI